MVEYQSLQLKRDLKMEGIPDFTIEEISNSVLNDLVEAGIGKNPFFIVAFSMGGVISREIILKLTSD